ncbi:MAG TPA: FKBP-type peptidyl-prolyl cis-trans isomerase [Flavisolibacter sp.]
MKRILLVALVLISVASYAQKQPAKKPATQKPVPAKSTTSPVLKNQLDSVSYVIGLSVANFYTQQGIKELNANVVAKAINDVLGGKKTLIAEDQANNIMMDYMRKAQEAKAKPNIENGRKFLAQNKTKPGVITTASGLQYEVITQGTGVRATAADTVVAHYAGTLLDGTEFDNSYKRGAPITIPVGSVIRGWTEALQLMPVGSKYKLYIPFELGYGTHEAGSIPPGSVLIFEVELLEVKPKQ